MLNDRSPAVADGESGRPPSGPFLPALLLLFAGSGCAALIYEVVWFQMLQLVIGSSGISLGVLLASFMGGMFLGSLALPRAVAPHHHPLLVYAAIEAAIGVLGLLLWWLVPALGAVYSGLVGHGLAAIALRAALCTLLLLPPTMLMGATLPAIARWVEATPRGIAWMGFFYGGNIAGAVCGSLLAAFYLLRVHDMAIATGVAAAINGAAALGAFVLARVAPRQRAPAPTQAGPPPATPRTVVFAREARMIHVAIALSGFTALGAEVVWTRLLSLLIGGTVYTFAIILAVFLAGLGAGSAGGSLLPRTHVAPRHALGVCQLLLVPAIAWTAFMIARAMPYWPIMPTVSASPWSVMQLDVVRVTWAILPATLLWGASFPLAVAAASPGARDPAGLIAGVYAANTIGAILGATMIAVVLIPTAGTQAATRLLIALAGASALLLFLTALRPAAVASPVRSTAPHPAWLVGAAIAGIVLFATVPPVPPVLIAYGRFSAATHRLPKVLYVGEGLNSSIAVTEQADGRTRHFHVSGKVEAGTTVQDMQLQRMLGHLSALLHEKPRSVLVVGFGAGVTAGSFITHPSVERIVICEIEPLIPRVVAGYFRNVNYDVLTDPRVELVQDDARHYLLTTDEKFDVISSDPIHPWVKGSAALYTTEYFQLAKRHLNPGGIMTQWVPLYQSNADAVKSELATFFEVFPGGTVWSNYSGGAGYDVVLAGAAGPLRIDVDRLERRFQAEDHEYVRRSLGNVGFGSVTDLLGRYAVSAQDLHGWLRGADINRDRNLRLMYLAGLGLNLLQNREIHAEMLAHRTFPEDLFVGSEAGLLPVREKLALRQD